MADTVTPPDKDLTMLNQEPEAMDRAFTELLNSDAAKPLTAAPTTRKEAIIGLQNESATNRSIQEGIVDPELDFGKSMFEGEDDVRSRNQSEWVKGAKAIGGGLYQGSLIVLEQLGYVADLDTYTNAFKENADLSGNWWTELMSKAQDAGRESDMFKIYEEAPNENSIASQIFKWTSLEGAVSSAVGFGLAGLGAATVVSKIGALGKFKQLGALTDTVMGNITGKSMVGATKAFAGPLGSSLMANYYMGQMMAADTFEATMEQLAPAIKGGMDPYEAQKLANNQAQEVVGLNMALVATSYLRFGSIFRRSGKLKGLVENPSALNQLKNLVIKGSPTAFTENVYQEMIQMEQIHDASEKAGIASDYSKDFWNRATNLALSNRALHAGALGVVGGPIQFAVIQKPFMREQHAEQRSLYKAQQESMNWMEALKKDNYQGFLDHESSLKNAILSGKMEDVKLAEDMKIIDEISKFHKNGIISYLRKDVEAVAEMTPEQLEKNNYDSTAAETAQQFLDTIVKSEEVNRTHLAYENTSEIIFNRLTADRVAESYNTAFGKKMEITNKVLSKIEQATGITADALSQAGLKKGEFRLHRAKDRFDGMDAKTKTKLLEQEAKASRDLDMALQDDTDISELNEVIKDETKYRDLHKKLNSQYTKFISPEYQKNYKAKKDNAGKNIANEIQKNEEALEDVKLKEESSKYSTFAREKNLAPIETESVRRDRITKWNEQVIKSETHPFREGTFSSIDQNKKQREFTKGDLVRSHDGRYFNVLHQNKAAASKGLLSSPTMPIIVETDSKGKTIKGKQPFVLEDNNWLRPETSIYENNRGDSNKGGRRGKWKMYAKPDSLLRPHFKNAQQRIQERAENAEAITVNGMEYETNRPNGALVKTKFAEEYAVHELNEPFTSPYTVELKLRDEGTAHRYIDVYKTGADGKQYKLTRLDRNSNLNHDIIAKALLKGPVTAKIVEHYSSSRNLVVMSDADGKKIYSPLSSMADMNKSNLINGKVWIAQTNISADYPTDNPMTVATSEDGTVITEGTIDVTMPDGTVVPKDIPFNAMHAGDTYSLILSPGGNIVPVALTGKNVGEIESKKAGNETYAEDIRDTIISEIRKFYADRFGAEELVAFEQESDNNEVSNKLTDKEAVAANRTAKWKDLQKSFGELQQHFQDNVYQMIRPTHYYSSYMEGGVWKAHDINGKKIFNPNFFQVRASISNEGKIVPVITVRNERNITKTIDISLAESPAEFMFELNRRRSKMSIDVLANPVAEGTTVNRVAEIINSDELSTDLNLSQPFAGSSATLQVDGSDIQIQGQEIASKRRSYYDTKYVERVKEVSEVSQNDFIEDMNERFSDLIDSMPTDIDYRTVTAYMDNFASQLDVIDTGHAIRIGKEFFKKDGILGMEAEYKEIMESLDQNISEESRDAMAKGMLMKDRLLEEIESGKLKIKLKDVNKFFDSPEKYGSQKEGITFTKGSPATHINLGEVTVHKGLRDSYYYVKTYKHAAAVKVWAKDLYKRNGLFDSLMRRKKELAAAIASENEVLIAAKTKSVKNIENKLIKEGLIKDNKTGQALIDEKSKTKMSNEDGSPLDANIDIVKELGNYTPRMAGIVEEFANTDRTAAIAKGAFDLNNLYRERGEKYYAEEGKVSNLTPVQIKEIYEGILDAFPYTINELESLIKEAKDKGMTIEVNKLTTSLNALQYLIDYLDGAMVTEYTKVTSRGEMRQIVLSEHWGKGSSNNLSDKILGLYGRYKLVIGQAVEIESVLRSDLFFATEGAETTTTPSAEVKDSKDNKSGKGPKVDDTTKAPEVLSPTVTVTEKEVADAKATTEAKIETIINSVITGDEASDMIRQFKIMMTVMDDVQLFNTLDTALKDLQKVDVGQTAESYALSTEDTTYVNENASAAQITQFNVDIDNATTLEQKKSITDKFIYNELGKPPFKVGEEVSLSQEEFQYEVDQAKAMLPQVPIEVVENVAYMVNKYGQAAIGAFDKGVRVLVQGAKEGTAYHETFHAVVALHLRPFEKQQIAEEHGFSSWNLELEEKLADMFAEYAKKKLATNDDVITKIKDGTRKLFNNLIAWFKGTRSTDITERIFEKTVTGGFANSKSLNYLSNMDNISLRMKSIEDFKNSLSAKENVTLQKLISDKQLIIEC